MRKTLLWQILFSLVFSTACWASWKVDLSKVPENVRIATTVGLGEINLNDLSLGEVDDLIKLIHLNSQYDTVKALLLDERTLQIVIEPKSRIASVNFKGLQSLTLSDVKKIVTVQPGDTFDYQGLVNQVQALQDYLKGLGYINAEVDVEYPQIEIGKIDLSVNIKLGIATKIDSIELKMQNDAARAQIKSKLNSYLGDILTDGSVKEIQETIENRLKQNKAFQSIVSPVQIFLNQDRSKAQLIFKIENDTSFEFEIVGSTQISSLIGLDDVLELQTVTLGSTNLIPELTNRIRQHYFKKGYARVEIASETQVLASGKRKVTFKVKEGPVVKIEKFIFQGRISRSSEYYTKLLKNNAEPLIQKNFYLKEELDQALENMRKELQNQGYLLAQVVSSRAIYNTNRDRINITVNLDEGQLTQVDSVVFENVKNFSQQELKEVVELNAGIPLQLSKIEMSIQNLKRFYKERGYLEMMVLNERQDLVRYNQDNSKANLVYKIFEGPQVKVQSIVIEGLRKTKEYVVRYELDFKEGELLTPNKIEESISRLQRTGHFTSVDIRTLEDKTEVSDRTVLIRVNEADPGLFQMGVGLTNERDLTVRGYLGVAYRNIEGTGRGVSFRLDGNYNMTDLKYLENRFTIGYLEPFLLDTRYKGRVNLTRSNSVTDFERRRATLTVQQTWSIEKDFTSHVTGVWDVYSRASSEDFNIRGALEKETLEIASTGLTLDLDYRDNLVRPRVGHQSRFNIEYGAPGLGSTKTIEFLRTSASATYYKSFNNNSLTWSNGVRYGFLQNLSTRSDGGVPYNKKGFYLGGPSTIRGFDPTKEAFPTSELLDAANDKMTKQTRMYLVRSTFSYPITGIVEGTVFYDGGQVEFDGLKEIARTSNIPGNFGYRHAAGLGILINTPVGPLNLELGFKLNQKSGEAPSAFHLSFGSF